MIGKTIILGANLMEISSKMIFKTNVFSIPWRRNILTGLWLVGFAFFCIGLKMNGE